MSSESEIFRAYSTTDPGEMALVAGELDALAVEFQVHEDTNLFGGFPNRILLVSRPDAEVVADLLSRLYADGVLSNRPLIAGLPAERDAAVRSEAGRRARRFERVEGEIAESIIRRHWKKALLPLLLPPAYALFQKLGWLPELGPVFKRLFFLY